MTAIAHDIDTASPEPFSDQELAAWRGMLQVHAQVTQALDAQMRSEHGLSVSSYEVLMFLADAPGRRMRMSEIAERVLLSRSGLTRLADRAT
jgi:DNA-binding MarR family transcriptional regulator